MHETGGAKAQQKSSPCLYVCYRTKNISVSGTALEWPFVEFTDSSREPFTLVSTLNLHVSEIIVNTRSPWARGFHSGIWVINTSTSFSIQKRWYKVWRYPACCVQVSWYIDFIKLEESISIIFSWNSDGDQATAKRKKFSRPWVCVNSFCFICAVFRNTLRIGVPNQWQTLSAISIRLHRESSKTASQEPPSNGEPPYQEGWRTLCGLFRFLVGLDDGIRVEPPFYFWLKMIKHHGFCEAGLSRIFDNL